MPAGVPAVGFLIQFPDTASGKAAEHTGAGVLGAHTRDLNAIFGSCFTPGPTLTMVGSWGVNQQIGAFFLYVSIALAFPSLLNYL